MASFKAPFHTLACGYPCLPTHLWKKLEAAHTCSCFSKRKEDHEFEAILDSKKEKDGGRSEGDPLLYLLGGLVEEPLTYKVGLLFH